MSDFSSDTDEERERAAYSDSASDRETTKDAKVSEVITKFLQEDSDHDSRDSFTSKATAKDPFDEKSSSKTAFSELFDSDEDTAGSIRSSVSRTESVSGPSSSFRHKKKPIFIRRNSSEDESDGSSVELTRRKEPSVGRHNGMSSKKVPHGDVRSSHHDKDRSFSREKIRCKENEKGDSNKEESRRKKIGPKSFTNAVTKRHQTDSLKESHDKKDGHKKGTELSHDIKSPTKRHLDEKAKRNQAEGDGYKNPTKSSHSTNKSKSVSQEKRNDSEQSKWNAGITNQHSTKNYKRGISCDDSSSSEGFVIQKRDRFPDKRPVSRDDIPDKRRKLDGDGDNSHGSKTKSRPADRNDAKYRDADRKKEKTHNISTQPSFKTKEQSLERKSHFADDKKAKQSVRKEENRSGPKPSSPAHGLSFYSCTTSSSNGDLLHSGSSSKPEIKRQRSASPVFAKVKVGGLRVFVESCLQDDWKLWQTSRVNLMKCDHLVKKYHKPRKHDGLSSKGLFHSNSSEHRVDRDKKEFSKSVDVVKSHKDGKAHDHNAMKKSREHSEKRDHKTKHSNKEKDISEKQKVKAKENKTLDDVKKHSSSSRGSDGKSGDKSVSKMSGENHSKENHSRKSVQSLDRPRSHSLEKKSHHISKSHSVNHLHHKSKSDHHSKSHRHPEGHLPVKSQDFVRKKEQKRGLEDDGFSSEKSSRVDELQVSEAAVSSKRDKKGIGFILSDSEDVISGSDCNENVKISYTESIAEGMNNEPKADFCGSDGESTKFGIIKDTDNSMSKICTADESSISEGLSLKDLPESESGIQFNLNDADARFDASNLDMCDAKSECSADNAGVLRSTEQEELKEPTDANCDENDVCVSLKDASDCSLDKNLPLEIDSNYSNATPSNSEADGAFASETVLETSVCAEKDVNQLSSLERDDVSGTDVGDTLDTDKEQLDGNLDSVQNQMKENEVEDKELSVDAEPTPEVLPLVEPLVSDSNDEVALDSSKLEELSNTKVDDPEMNAEQNDDFRDTKSSEVTENDDVFGEKQPLTPCWDGECSEGQQALSSQPDGAKVTNTINDTLPSELNPVAGLPLMLPSFDILNAKTDRRLQPFVMLERLPDSMARKLLADWEKWLKRKARTKATSSSEECSSSKFASSLSSHVEKLEGKSRDVGEKIEKDKYNAEDKKKRKISSVEDGAEAEPSAQRLKSDQKNSSFGGKLENEKKRDAAGDVIDPVSRSLMKVKAEFKKQGGVLGKLASKEKKPKTSSVKEETSVDTDFLFSEKRSKINSFVIPKVKPGDKKDKKKNKTPQLQYETVIWTPPPVSAPRIRRPPFPTRTLTEEDRDRSVLGKVEETAKERDNSHWQPMNSWRGNPGNPSARAGDWRRFGPPNERPVDPWNRQVGPYGRDQGKWNPDASKSGINGSMGPGRLPSRNSDSVGFQRNPNSFNSRGGGQPMSSNWSEKQQHEQQSSEKKENSSANWIRLYNRDPLGLMSQSDDFDVSFSPPGVADDGDDDDMVTRENRYEAKSAPLTDDSDGMLENVKLLANTIQEVLTSGSVSAEKRQKLSDFHSQLQKNLVLPSSVAQDNLTLLNMICNSLSQAKNFVNLFQCLMQDAGSSDLLQLGTSSTAQKPDGRKSNSIHSTASVGTPNSMSVCASDMGPCLSPGTKLRDIDERVNRFKDIDERRSFINEPLHQLTETVHDLKSSGIQRPDNSNEMFGSVNDPVTSKNFTEQAKSNTISIVSPPREETKSEAVKAQELVVSKIEDELHLLQVLVTIQCELAEIDDVDDSTLVPNDDVCKTLQPADSESAAPPPLLNDSSTTALSNVVSSSPAGRTVTSSLADDESRDSMQSSVSKQLLRKTPNEEPKTVDPKILEDKVVALARNALKPYYHRGVVTSEEFKLIMRKVIGKVHVKTEDEIKEAKIVQLIGAYVDRIVSQRKKLTL